MSFWSELRQRNVGGLVDVWEELRDRRLVRIVGGYLAGGWLVLQGVDQLVSHQLASGLAYRLALVGYLAGFPASVILGWFHGEKGAQKLTWTEIGMLGLVAAGGVVAGVLVVQEYRTSPEALAERTPLDLREVAVLYYEDRSEEADLAAITGGLTESLIGKLDQVNQLEVVSANGVRPYRHTDLSPDSVARALGVGTLITGSISGPQDRMRITTRLVDGNSGTEVARKEITASQEELLVARDSISEGLSRDLRQWIGQELTYRTQRAETGNVRAWVGLQRGERLLRQARAAASHHRPDSALVLFQRADSVLALAERADSTWAGPVVARARVAYRKARMLIGVAGDRHAAGRALERGLRLTERALALTPGDARALEVRGTIRYAKWFFGLASDPDEREALLEAAREDLEAAVNRDPTLASAYSTLSHLYYQPEARDLLGVALAARRAYEADAYLEETRGILSRLFVTTLDLGQFGQARRWCEEGRERFPDDYRFRLCRLRLLATPELEPDVREAWRLARAVDSLAPADERPLRPTEAEMYVGGVLAQAGFPDSARNVLSRARSRVTHEVDPRDYLLGIEAYMRTLLGEEDRAIDLLRRYVSAHPDHEFGAAGEVSWRWRDLQDNPRFQRIRETR